MTASILTTASGCVETVPPPRIVPGVPPPRSAVVGPGPLQSLRIVALANMNGVFDPVQDAEGRRLGGLSALVHQLEDEGLLEDDALIFDNGDLWTHSPVVRMDGPESILAVFDALGLDGWNLGHHEYGLGLDALAELRRRVDFPWLGSNVVRPEGGLLPFLTRVVEVDAAETRVCVFGLAHQETLRLTRAEAVQGIRFSRYEAAWADELESLRSSGRCQLIVTLLHDEPSVVVTTLERLRVPGPDLVIAADAPDFSVRLVGSTMVVHPGAYAREYAVISAVRGPRGSWRFDAEPRKLGPPPDEDPEALAPYRAAQRRVSKVLDQVLGVLPRTLSPGTFERSALGHFVVDAWLEAMPDVDVALLNYGALRAPLAVGPVTEGKLRQAMPFDDRLVRLQLTAAQLRLVLQYGKPVVAGLTWSFRQHRRCREVATLLHPDGRSMDADERFEVVTLDFVAQGGDGFPLPEMAVPMQTTDLSWREPVRARLARMTENSRLPAAQFRGRRLRSGTGAPDGAGPQPSRPGPIN